MYMQSGYSDRSTYHKETTSKAVPFSGVSAFFGFVFGLALSLFGSFVMLTVLIKLKEIFENPEKLKLYLALVPQEENLRTIVYQGQPIILPPASFHYFSYGICIAVLMVAGLIGASLLKRGIAALIP